MRDDTISRKEAIDGFYEMASDMDHLCTVSDYVQFLESLPHAQHERKRGEWIFYEDRAPVWDIAGEKTWARAYKCSECGFVHSVIEDFGQYAFCPNCGADMREVEDG